MNTDPDAAASMHADGPVSSRMLMYAFQVSDPQRVAIYLTDVLNVHTLSAVYA